MTTRTKTRTHYDVLGVDRDADDVEIRRAWKVLVQVWHPDRFSDGDMRDEAEAHTQRINEAWSTLRDATRRAGYDRRIDADREARAASASGRRRSAGDFASSPFGATQPASTASSWSGGAPVPTPGAAHLHRGAAARAVPVGPPPTLVEQVETFSREFVEAARRYPRITTTVAAVWIMVFGWALVQHVAFGPTMPPSVEAAVSSQGSTGAMRAAHVRHLRDATPAIADQLPTDAELGLVDAGGPATDQAGAGDLQGPPQVVQPGAVAPPPVAPAGGTQPAPRVLHIRPNVAPR